MIYKSLTPITKMVKFTLGAMLPLTCYELDKGQHSSLVYIASYYNILFGFWGKCFPLGS